MAKPTIHNTKFAPLVGKVIAEQSGKYIIQDFDIIRDLLERSLTQQRLTNLYLSHMADEDLTAIDLEEE